jgi:type VI protein secretion system component Hcp
VQTLVVSLFVSFILSLWPLSAVAKGNNSSRVQTHDITITHKYDKPSPVIAKKKGTTKGATNFGDIKGESTDKDHKDW